MKAVVACSDLACCKGGVAGRGRERRIGTRNAIPGELGNRSVLVRRCVVACLPSAGSGPALARRGEGGLGGAASGRRAG